MTFLLTILRPFAAVVFWAMQKYQRKYRRLPQSYFFALGKITPVTAFELLVIRPGAVGGGDFSRAASGE